MKIAKCKYKDHKYNNSDIMISYKQLKNNSVFDVAFIITLSIVIYIVSLYFNLFDKAVIWLRDSGDRDFLEIILIASVTLLAVSLLSMRKWLVLKREIFKRKQIEKLIIRNKNDLEEQIYKTNDNLEDNIQKLKLKITSYEKLKNLMDLLSSAINNKELIWIINKKINLLEGIDTSLFYLLDKRKEEAILTSKNIFPESFVSKYSKIYYSGQATWDSIVSGKPVLVNIDDPNYYCSDILESFGYQSACAIPLKNKKNVFGVIWFMKEKGTFDNDQSNYLQLLSNIISLSMSSSQNLN